MRPKGNYGRLKRIKLCLGFFYMAKCRKTIFYLIFVPYQKQSR